MRNSKFKKIIIALLLGVSLCTYLNTAMANPWDEVTKAIRVVQGELSKIGSFFSDTVPGYYTTLTQDFSTLTTWMTGRNTDSDTSTQAQMLSTYKVNSDTTNTVSTQGTSFQNALTNTNLTQNQINAYKRQDTYKEGDKQYSTVDSNTLYLSDQHTATQSQAAKDFILNASGANIGIPKVQYSKPTPDVITAVAFNKFITAQASSSTNTLTKAYASRQKTSMGTSQKKLTSDMTVGNTQQKSFFSQLSQVPILGQILSAANQFLSFVHLIYEYGEKLESMVVGIVNLGIQSTMAIQTAIGNPLHQSAVLSLPGALINKAHAHE